MNEPGKERRRYERYDNTVKIHFRVTYNLKTKVTFQVIDQDKQEALSPKYLALSKNVSAEGICFTSAKKLDDGNALHLEVYVPGTSAPVHMRGEVRWCRPIAPGEGEEDQFDAGVKVLTVNEKSVAETIYYDTTHQIFWSAVLEAIFGSFSALMHKKMQS